MMRNIFYFFIILSFITCQPKPELYKDISLDEFILEDGFEIELVAGEPLLNSPMAMSFDDKGRIWVAEMPGYMRDLDGNDEYKPDGQIVILEDTDGDGKMDNRKIFLENLVLPRALTLVYGGLLYVETPNLYWISIENDKPGKRELVDSLYVRGGNIEHQPNGLLYNIDNWIYSAKCQHRYRRKDGKWEKEATTFRGQWGITNDDNGRLFYNDNSNPLYGDYMPPNILTKNPYQKVKYGYQQNICEDRRVYPYQATSVNRGYQEGVLDTTTQMLNHFTSACSPLIYRGDNFPKDYYGNAFVCAPEINALKRILLHDENGKVVGQQAYEGKEFLISKDETFRPINLYNAPDGSMYLIDLRKGVIQHRAYMTRYLRDQIVEKGLDEVTGIGRIYKITHKDKPIEKVNLPKNDDIKGWIALLKSKNAWQRERAQRWLIDHKNQIDSKDVISLCRNNSVNTKIQAFWTAHGLGHFEKSNLFNLIKDNQESDFFAHVLLLADSLSPKSIESMLFNMRKERGGMFDLTRYYATSVMSRKSKEFHHFHDLGKTHGFNPLSNEILLSGIAGEEETLYKEYPSWFKDLSIAQLVKEIIENKKNNDIQVPVIQTGQIIDNRNRGMDLYALHCASCHGLDGKGMANLAPPLYQSEFIAGEPHKLALISLQGIKGEITVKGQTYNFGAPMPGYKDNSDLTDQNLSEILSFVRNGFGSNPKHIPIEFITEMRQAVSDRTEPFDQQTLEAFIQNLE